MDIKRCIRSFLARKWITRRSLERVLGKLQHVSIVHPVGKTALKFLNKYLLSFARKGRKDKVQRFPSPLRVALQRWISTDALDKKVLWTPPPASLDIHTDASLQGWGAHSADARQLSGLWSPMFVRLHINILELVAVYLAIKKFRLQRGTRVRLHSDNTTAVHCLNRRGSA